MSSSYPCALTTAFMPSISSGVGSSSMGGGSVRLAAGTLVALMTSARPEDVVACARLDRLSADLEGDVAVEDPEALVVALVDVERRLGAGMFGHLHDRHLSAGVGGGGLELRERAEPPASPALTLAHRQGPPPA
jgi:hypothetical protein